MNKENIDPRTGKEVQQIKRGPHRAPFTDITTTTTPLKTQKPKPKEDTIINNYEGDRNLMRKLKSNKRSPVKYFR